MNDDGTCCLVQCKNGYKEGLEWMTYPVLCPGWHHLTK